mmetsp:Transcript_24209/g.60616  ORF Transcript_24209/g.60616 Transcript_24209/m.60616 type:complete len:200 (-) Transcript_24209:172-771(-)
MQVRRKPSRCLAAMWAESPHGHLCRPTSNTASACPATTGAPSASCSKVARRIKPPVSRVERACWSRRQAPRTSLFIHPSALSSCSASTARTRCGSPPCSARADGRTTRAATSSCRTPRTLPTMKALCRASQTTRKRRVPRGAFSGCPPAWLKGLTCAPSPCLCMMTTLFRTLLKPSPSPTAVCIVTRSTWTSSTRTAQL